MPKLTAVAVACLLLAASPAAAQRLSGTVVPESYALWFAPNLQEETFRGRATIGVQLKAPSASITLHAAEMAFGEVTITAGGVTQVARVTLDPGSETATFTVPTPIPAGAASIEIAYTGVLNDKLRGFYISKANGRSYAVTQMEPTDARRAFPSFDEPIYKSTFDISLMVDSGDVAISNGAQVSDTPGPEPGKRTLTFARTPRMSTYLVAMIVGDFVCREGSSDGTAIRICSTPDKRELTAFALEAAAQQVKFYNDYFGIKYPFGKLDIIAVPDFAAGAMENAGAITFRERLLLVDPQRSSVDVMKSVASVISHEIAHQWFGNLVTMKWWDDIWLNEGFATWMASKPLIAWRPEWRMQLADAQDTQAALGLDGLRSTRAIRTKVETPDEINEVFDGIAYEKTAGVLRMIEGYVGEEVFRKAIASYVAKFSYGNAAGEDFWTEVTRVTGRPIDRILQSYVDQAGAPVLTIRDRCTAGASELSVSQQRFTGGSSGGAPAAGQWTLPACFTSIDGGQARCEIVDDRQETFAVPGCTVFANSRAQGYYFTEYAPEAVRALAKNGRALQPVERLSLLGDEWWMVRAGRHDIGVYLDVAAGFAADDTPAVADTIADRLGYTGGNIADAAQQPRFQAWVRQTFSPALTALGLPGTAGESDDRHSLRATLLTLVGVIGNDPAVQQRARDLASGYMANPSSLPATLAPTVLQVAALGGDRALYDQYLAQLQKAANEPEEYYRFLNALTWFRDPALVQRTLAYALSDAVRTQDTGTVIGQLIARGSSRAAAWTFAKTEWRTITQKLGTFQGIPTIVTSVGAFCSAREAADVRAFFARNPVPAAERTLQQAIERIESCVAVDERQSRPFAAWLAAR